MIDIKKVIERWRKVLDASDPVVDEANAAEFLEMLEIYFSAHKELGSRAPTIWIPSFRRMLSSFKLHYDPTLRTHNPITVPWIFEYDEETLRTMYAMDLDAESVNEMTLHIENEFVKIGHELYVNLRVSNKEVIIHAEPYEAK